MTTLHCQTYGSEGPALMLIHGLFGSSDNLRPIARGLADQFKVYAPDLRNHGRSPHSPTMNYELMAQDLRQLMDSHHIEKAFVVGHSMGGKAAMQLALDYPDRVEKLVVADIAPVDYPPHHDEIFTGLEALDLESINSIRDADQALTPYESDPGIRSFLLKNLTRTKDKRYQWQINLKAIRENYPAIAAGNQGSTYKGSTLFIKGGNSSYIQESHRNTVQSLFPSAEIKIIPGTGHWLHAEKPTLFISTIKRFLEK